MKKLAVLLMLLTLASSCTERNENVPITKAPDKTGTMGEISLAKVNNATITAEDLREEFNLLSVQAQQMFMTEGGFEDLLNELIKKEMLYQEAKKRGYTSTDEFKDIVEDYEKRVMIGFLLRDEVEKRSQVTEEEVRKYYDDNRKEFQLEAPKKGKPDVVDFDSVKHLIKEHLEAKKQTEVFDSYIAKLKESYKVDIDKDSFNKTFGNITAPPEEQGLKKEEQ
jgi:peptidyl-prolyl cis-trans isomerase C